MREILFVAGETSGDQHAAAVATALRSLGATYALVGVGGDAMQRAGVTLIEHVSKLAVMGFVEPLKRLSLFRRVRHALRERIQGGRVALVVLVDFGGFNLHIAELACKAGVPVLYFITPQVWASRPGRMDRMARTVTRAAVILPFEEKLLREHGVNATFVGHPLVDGALAMPTRDAAREALGLSSEDRVLALFPGSRRQEIEHHLDAFVETGRELQRRIPRLKVIVSAAPNVAIPAGRCPFPISTGSSMQLLSAADGAMCKSGTTTLEAAVAGCPLVVAYRTDRISFAVAKRLIRIPFIGLVNVLANRMIAREFVQGDLVPARVADALESLLDGASPIRARMLAELRAVRDSLGEPGAARRVATIALGMADANAA